MNLDTKDIICIGDAPMDFEMSENAKLKVLFSWVRTNSNENLLNYQNCVRSLSEIKLKTKRFLINKLEFYFFRKNNLLLIIK